MVDADKVTAHEIKFENHERRITVLEGGFAKLVQNSDDSLKWQARQFWLLLIALVMLSLGVLVKGGI